MTSRSSASAFALSSIFVSVAVVDRLAIAFDVVALFSRIVRFASWQAKIMSSEYVEYAVLMLQPRVTRTEE